MDNYYKLFNETRPERKDNDGMININTKDINNMINSEWLKNKERGLAALEQRSYNDAIKFLDSSIKENPNNHHLYSVRANIKEESGDSKGAINDFKMALYVGNDWYATYNQIAQNYYKLQDFENALTAFDIAIELKIKLDGSEDNLPSIMDGVVINENLEMIYTNRATIKLNLQDYEGCQEDCQKAIHINPEYSNSYFIFGVLFLTVGHMEKAKELLQIAANKGNGQALNFLNQYF